MTHRGRRLALLITTLVILGFVLNIISGKGKSGETAEADQEDTSDGPRPVAPVYVPRPSEVIYNELSEDSSPQAVARAFATAYAGMEPGDVTTQGVDATLPRLADDSRARVVRKVVSLWDAHQAEGRRPGPRTSLVESTVTPGESGKREKATVKIAFSGPGKKSGAGQRMTVRLTRGAQDGWLVTSIDTK